MISASETTVSVRGSRHIQRQSQIAATMEITTSAVREKFPTRSWNTFRQRGRIITVLPYRI